MPEDAARHFAVVGAVEPIYDKNIIIWQITLHSITKETAQEAEVPGLPISTAEIDADRERLTKVQDRIIWLAYRRYGIEAALKSGKVEEEQRKEFFNAGLMLAEEQKERIDEEAELRRDLESAGIHVLSTEERAKELLREAAGAAGIPPATRKSRLSTSTGRMGGI